MGLLIVDDIGDAGDRQIAQAACRACGYKMVECRCSDGVRHGNGRQVGRRAALELAEKVEVFG